MTNSDVTLLGATGFVGRRILRDLNEQGVKVQAVSRRPRPAELSAGITWTQVDLNDPARIAEIHWSETVISTVLISMTAQVSELWPPDPSRRLIAFSSTSALTKSESSESADRATSALLHDGEARVRALHPNTTILRPTMIYGGPGDRNVERVAMQLRKFPIFPLVGKGAGLRQPVHADDLATAAILCKIINGRGQDIQPRRFGDTNVQGNDSKNRGVEQSLGAFLLHSSTYRPCNTSPIISTPAL